MPSEAQNMTSPQMPSEAQNMTSPQMPSETQNMTSPQMPSEAQNMTSPRKMIRTRSGTETHPPTRLAVEELELRIHTQRRHDCNPLIIIVEVLDFFLTTTMPAHPVVGLLTSTPW